MSIEKGSIPIDKEEKVPKLLATPHEDLVEKYSVFRDAVHFEKGRIYHPCGAYDVSPSKAFPESEIIYADLDDKAMQALRKDGYQAQTIDVNKYDPGAVDLLILLNPGIKPDVPMSHVKDKGYILCNDHHRTATDIREKGQELVGILRNSNGKLTLDTNNPDDYWRQVETDAEFKNAEVSFGAVNYALAERIVQRLTGKTENILEDYKNIVQRVRNNELEGVSEVIDNGDVIVFQYKGAMATLLTRLPRKKGSTDDIFVFKKSNKNE